MEQAQDRVAWRKIIDAIWDVEGECKVHAVLDRRAGGD